MWLITINCSGDAWKRYANDFKAIADKYHSTCVSSKKTPDGQRFMEYKVEDVGDAESFQDECLSLEGFTASFESL
ncbi:hypothetical protein [Coleofasciculus sp. H7-2]|uniref:hypothetical protein n=1 Tax=Coleofasciculus sp. H7-2 TaxID=3351545 RepID=UPI0036717556